jgi:hypothetical protein
VRHKPARPTVATRMLIFIVSPGDIWMGCNRL